MSFLKNLFYSQDKIELNKYGWRKDKADIRDKIHNYKPLLGIEHIKEFDLLKFCPEVYKQGKLGSCTANAIAAAYEFDEIKQKEENIFTPSRLFIYYNERKIEGTIKYDSGAEIRDGIKSINKIGVCSESSWPYIINNFIEKPSDLCYKEAKTHKTIKYRRIEQTLEQLKSSLFAGFPIVFGFNVYESFESQSVTDSGMMPMPKLNEKILGGHAVLAVGFDENKNCFLIRNSWGINWGNNGYFYMPYDFISNSKYASDFWTIKNVTHNKSPKYIKNN
jgi:C1A family cysteine protease